MAIMLRQQRKPLSHRNLTGEVSQICCLPSDVLENLSVARPAPFSLRTGTGYPLASGAGDEGERRQPRRPDQRIPPRPVTAMGRVSCGRRLSARVDPGDSIGGGVVNMPREAHSSFP